MKKGKKLRIWDKYSVILPENPWKLDKRKQPTSTPTGMAQEIMSMIKEMKVKAVMEMDAHRATEFSAEYKKMEIVLEHKLAKLVFISERDPLTKLFTRKVFEERAKYLLKNDFDFAVIVIDLNNLKYVNDKYGHIMGDEYILALSNAIRDLAHQYRITAARAGGDEFYLLMPLYPTIRDKRRYILEFKYRLFDKFYDKCSKFAEIKDMACFSLGFETKENLQRQDQEVTLQKLISLADANMYKEKVQQKISNECIYKFHLK